MSHRRSQRSGVQTRSVDSELGSWSTVEWSPGEGDPLAGLVERIWHSTGATECRRYRVLPHGLVEIVVVLDGSYAVFADGRPTVLSGIPVVKVGTHLRPAFMKTLERRFTVLGMRLHPALASAILGHPLEELDWVLNLELALGAPAGELADRLHQDATAIGRVRWARRWLRRQTRDWGQDGRDDRAVAWMADELLRSGGAVRISKLAARLGMPGYRLSRDFRRRMGVTPKRFARAHRFRTLLRELQSNKGTPLSTIALRVGYYDQAHMNNEFKEMSGLTPTQFRSQLGHYHFPYRVLELPSRSHPAPSGS